MGVSPERRLVVKNGFYEVVDKPGNRIRAFTDSVVESFRRRGEEEEEEEEEAQLEASEEFAREPEEQDTTLKEVVPDDVGHCSFAAPSAGRWNSNSNRKQRHRAPVVVHLDSALSPHAHAPPNVIRAMPLSLDTRLERATLASAVLPPALPSHLHLSGQQGSPQRHEAATETASQSSSKSRPSARSLGKLELSACLPSNSLGGSKCNPRQRSGLHSDQHNGMQQESSVTTTTNQQESSVTTTSNRLPMTTVMLRNLPNRYTRAMLLAMLDEEGFAGRYNFVYLPIDFKTHSGLGYAFVDLCEPEFADELRQHFEGFSRWCIQSDKVCTVSWSHPEQQGLAAHIKRYRNSPVMHGTVPDDWKPMLFQDGQPVPFPPPQRKLRAPHMRPAP